MVLRKLEGTSLALQISALAVFAVFLSNIVTIMFFFGDRAEVVRAIITQDVLQTMKPIVKAVVEGRSLENEKDVTVDVLGNWKPDSEKWQRSPLIEAQMVASFTGTQVEIYLPPIRAISPAALFRQVQQGGPRVAAVVRTQGKEPVLIIVRVTPNLPPPFVALVGTLISALLIMIGTMLMIGRMTKSLRLLARASARIGQNTEIELVPERGPPELRSAAHAFNLMSTRIAQLLDRQRSTLWALGHDLRTPVTAMRIRLELVDDEETREKLKTSVEEIERVVEDALVLARAGLASGPSKYCSLNALVKSAVDGLIEVDAMAKLRIVVHPCLDIQMKVREGEMVRAIRNLVHNGLRHTNGPVHVKISSSPNVTIQVEDWGPGLPALILASPGQPFARGDQARSSDGNLGLGLAIVRTITESHGGQLVAKPRRDGSGTVFTLIFNDI